MKGRRAKKSKPSAGIQVCLLGAGAPAHGERPAALKTIALNTRAIDWQMHCFASVVGDQPIHYLGGYHVDEVIRRYPQLHFTVIPDWQKHNALHTLLAAPFSDQGILFTYSDTVFRKKVIRRLITQRADLVFGIDSQWQERYQSRSAQDIAIAEKINCREFDRQANGLAEFTGLIYGKPKVAAYLAKLSPEKAGSTLIDLLRHLKGAGFSVKMLEVANDWAEFNAPEDVARFLLGTKAETLERLEPLVTNSHIGRQVSLSAKQWRLNPAPILAKIKKAFGQQPLVIRSSARSEDSWLTSNAGGYKSLLNVANQEAEIQKAIAAVLISYGAASRDDDQILVQAFLSNVSMSGVVFTCGLETGSQYYRFNFEGTAGAGAANDSVTTDSVTSGTHGKLRMVVLSRNGTEQLKNVEPSLHPVLAAVQELETLLGYGKLDIEFAIDTKGRVHIFQVRPITVDHSAYEIEQEEQRQVLHTNAGRFEAYQKASPFVLGKETIFGNMPDWNPAEIIGTRPKPLAFSLYRQLITNEVWATQRAEFGYRDVRPQPLIVAFAGQPYVDVRASLNSFIPATLEDAQAEKLAQAYLEILRHHPERHDKLEFDVAFTVWTPTFAKEASDRLTPHGVDAPTLKALEESLKNLTRQALSRLEGDIAPALKLAERRQRVVTSSLPAIDQFFALLSDCRHYGTLAFSHAARAGFVASTLLRSLVKGGILSNERRHEFMNSVHTVTSEFELDKQRYRRGEIPQSYLIEHYGHLRPGTYDIGVKAYWEDADLYFASSAVADKTSPPPFVLTATEKSQVQEVLNALGSDLDPAGLMDYCRAATEARERVKFEFTKNLSRALDALVLFGAAHAWQRDELAFLEYDDLMQCKLNVVDLELLRARAKERQRLQQITELIELPTLIRQVGDFYGFERHTSQPNFVTNRKAESLVAIYDSRRQVSLDGKIILIPQADPGYDWLFGQSIAGLITKYGGANSHMAIRAAEIGLPAAIGVGDKLYERISQMRRVELDCASEIIREVL